MNYYALDYRVTDPDLELAHLDEVPYTPVPWTMGVPYAGKVGEPIRCTLHPQAGSRMPDMFIPQMPIFSDRMLEVLDAAGVDNIVRYRVELVAPNGGVYTN